MALTELPMLRGSIVALKGHLTHTLDQCDKFLMDPVDELTRGTNILFQEEITKRHGSLEEAVFSASCISVEEAEVKNQAIAAYEDWAFTIWSTLWKNLASLNQAASDSLLNAPQPPFSRSLLAK